MPITGDRWARFALPILLLKPNSIGQRRIYRRSHSHPQLSCTQAAISLTNARLPSNLLANETRIRDSEQRYVSLATAVPVGIFRTDAMRRCIYVNDRWCRLAGLTPDAAAGDGWQARLYSEDCDRITAEWYQSAGENRPFQLEYRFQRPDGQIIWVYRQSVAEQDADDQLKCDRNFPYLT